MRLRSWRFLLLLGLHFIVPSETFRFRARGKQSTESISAAESRKPGEEETQPLNPQVVFQFAAKNETHVLNVPWEWIIANQTGTFHSPAKLPWRRLRLPRDAEPASASEAKGMRERQMAVARAARQFHEAGKAKQRRRGSVVGPSVPRKDAAVSAKRKRKLVAEDERLLWGGRRPPNQDEPQRIEFAKRRKRYMDVMDARLVAMSRSWSVMQREVSRQEARWSANGLIDEVETCVEERTDMSWDECLTALFTQMWKQGKRTTGVA